MKVLLLAAAIVLHVGMAHHEALLLAIIMTDNTPLSGATNTGFVR
jgi:hypothetical protein